MAASRCRRLAVLGLLVLGGCATSEAPPIYRVEVVDTLAHPRYSFTQGLAHDGEWLYEGTGEYGRSELRRVDPADGSVQARTRLGMQHFGEGVAVVDDRLVQLTFHAGTAFVYDKATLEKRREFAYDGEGWGLTFDGERLIMSDGTAELRFLDPDSFEVLRRLEVRDAGGPLARLNELEYAEGRLYANIWKTERIAVIDPAAGRVTAWLDLGGVIDRFRDDPAVDVANGIAYDPAGGVYYITGKRWPAIYQVRWSETIQE